MASAQTKIQVVDELKKPPKTRQDHQTPPDLLAAIQREFRVLEWSCDLAADAGKAILTSYLNPPGYEPAKARYLGPGSPIAENSLAYDWTKLRGDLWLNSPFFDLEPWMVKCRMDSGYGRRIFSLTPASVGANWFQENVFNRAHVVALSPRVPFVGQEHPYTKDLVLAVWSGVRGGFSTWRWK